MSDLSHAHRKTLLAAAVCVIMLAMAAPADAHSIRLWARAAEGATIRGRAYTSGGRIADAEVEVFGTGGDRLGQVTTDAQGEFTWTATRRCDHTFVLETTDGHRAEATVKAEDLPIDLPPPGTDAATPSPSPGPEGPPSPLKGEGPSATVDTKAVSSGGADREDLRRMIDDAVARRTGPLMDKIDAYESRVRLHDVLGGIGYIVGATGIVFYLRAGRRKAQPAAKD